MKLTPYPVPHGWRLALLCAFVFNIYNQLSAQIQHVASDSVQNFELSTRLFQWSFDKDSLLGPHGEFCQIIDTAGGNDGPVPGTGFAASSGFSFSAYSVDPRARLRFGPFDTRGMDSVSFGFHLAAPSGNFENSDFIGLNISLDGGLTYYNQVKVKGSRNGTSAPGWQHGQGIDYRKNFRYASRSSVIYGHVNPVTKDTIDGISALTIENIPQSRALYILVELTNSTNGSEVYNVDNFTLSAKLNKATNVLEKQQAYRISNGGSFLALEDSLQTLYVDVPLNDTVKILGSPVVTGPVYIRGGYLDGALTVATSLGGAIHGSNFIGQQFVERSIVDTGYHFIGQPAYFSMIDTLPYAWIYDARAGDWAAPSKAASFPDSGVSMARVIYVRPQDVPMRLRALKSKVPSAQAALEWADTCLDGETPFGGWNLVANPTGGELNWNQLYSEGAFPDSADATVYLWKEGEGGYASFNSRSGPVGAGPRIGIDDAFWVRLSHENDPGVVRWDIAGSRQQSKKNSAALRSALHKASNGTDTVDFYFQSQASRQAAATTFHAKLMIDPVFSTQFMPCCDQLFLGSALQPQLVLRKSKSSVTVANFPKSSYYPLMVVGEGVLTAKGAPGYFYLPPNIYPGTSAVALRGKGPHKVYWLGADHPDVSMGEELVADPLALPEIPALPDANQTNQAWDVLGRPGGAEAEFELQFIDGAWKKVVRVK
jgi:hypothetical protein